MEAFARDLLNPRTLAGLVFFGAAFFVAATMAILLIRRATRRVIDHLTDVTAVRFISALAQVLTYVIAFVLYAHLVPGLRAIGTALLAGVSVASIVYRPFTVGDSVQINSPKGVISATVEAVSLGFTLLRDGDAHDVIVPNTVMVSTIIIRLNRARR